ncbi:MAG TPA: hypothetical protein VHO70_04970 [Chitinispirillaceae bacterium]|nr:hypothetical protein [Chitinispirillaceae bacterium]
MNNENYKSDMISERDAEELQSLEYGDHIEPPFWGTSNVLTWSTDTIFQSIKKQDLFKGEWAPGLGNDTIADLEILFTQLKDEVVESDLLQGYGMYGFFPVITEDEQLIIIDPADFHTELMALHFPRLDKSLKTLLLYESNRCILCTK